MKQTITRTIFGLFLLGVAPSVSAQSLVLGSGKAHECYQFAESGNSGTPRAIRTCEVALRETHLVRTDRHSTLINLGILEMRSGDHLAALRHFDRAIEMNSDLSEAHINRGAALIYLNRNEDAVEALSIALRLGTAREAVARFNRAMAFERSGQIQEAYDDLVIAQKLRADWQPVTNALARYEVVSQ